jgi:hypothetical protein
MVHYLVRDKLQKEAAGIFFHLVIGIFKSTLQWQHPRGFAPLIPERTIFAYYPNIFHPAMQ